MSVTVIGRTADPVMKMIEDSVEDKPAKRKDNMADSKLIDDTMKEYLDDLRSDSPAPGGGSVSALSGAEAAALLMMVCDLTIGKEKYADYQAACEKAKADLAPIFDELKEGIDKDTEAYNMVASAFRLPKGTDDEKAERSKAIQAGTIEATKVPLRNMRLSLDALKVAETMLKKYNPNCDSDFGVAALQLRVCMLGAWMNVAINLPGIKDQAKRDEFLTEAVEIKQEAEALSDKIEEALS